MLIVLVISHLSYSAYWSYSISLIKQNDFLLICKLTYLFNKCFLLFQHFQLTEIEHSCEETIFFRFFFSKTKMSTKSSPTTGPSKPKTIKRTSPSIKTSSKDSSMIKTSYVETSSSSSKTTFVETSSTTCQKCREVVQPLRHLPCLHSFCGVCIEDRLDQNNVFQCPVCSRVPCFLFVSLVCLENWNF